jgi:hypothetical protein
MVAAWCILNRPHSQGHPIIYLFYFFEGKSPHSVQAAAAMPHLLADSAKPAWYYVTGPVLPEVPLPSHQVLEGGQTSGKWANRKNTGNSSQPCVIPSVGIQLYEGPPLNDSWPYVYFEQRSRSGDCKHRQPLLVLYGKSDGVDRLLLGSVEPIGELSPANMSPHES